MHGLQGAGLGSIDRFVVACVGEGLYTVDAMVLLTYKVDKFMLCMPYVWYILRFRSKLGTVFHTVVRFYA